MHLFRFLIKFCRQKAPQADAITKGAPPHRIQNIGYRIHDTRYRIQDTRYKIQNKIQDTKYKIQDTGYKIKGGVTSGSRILGGRKKTQIGKGVRGSPSSNICGQLLEDRKQNGARG